MVSPVDINENTAFMACVSVCTSRDSVFTGKLPVISLGVCERVIAPIELEHIRASPSIDCEPRPRTLFLSNEHQGGWEGRSCGECITRETSDFSQACQV
jgi:hypothetical protein